MGRLFWKFFFAFLASFFIAGSGVGMVVWLHHNQDPGLSGQPDGPPPPPFGDPPAMRERPPPPPFGDPPTMRERPPAPSLLLPIAVAVVVSLLASALLAWYFAKPLRHLRWALGALADGNLDARIGPQLADRRDEIADLGRDFDDMARRLQQTVEAQRRLLHDVSHELRSPLARLQVAAGLARQDPARTAASLDRVEAEVGRLDRLVGELLTLSRLEAGDDRQQKAPIEVMELLAAVVEDAHYEAKANGRDLEFQEGAEFVIHGHRELLHRAFENVLRNAVKYTAPGTCVSVATRMLPGQGLSVLVCDRGPGVLPSELDTIFEPFHRGSGAGVEGFGLGLAIARRAVEAHGGSVSARNRDGGGLCVEIVL